MCRRDTRFFKPWYTKCKDKNTIRLITSGGREIARRSRNSKIIVSALHFLFYLISVLGSCSVVDRSGVNSTQQSERSYTQTRLVYVLMIGVETVYAMLLCSILSRCSGRVAMWATQSYCGLSIALPISSIDRMEVKRALPSRRSILPVDDPAAVDVPTRAMFITRYFSCCQYYYYLYFMRYFCRPPAHGGRRS